MARRSWQSRSGCSESIFLSTARIILWYAGACASPSEQKAQRQRAVSEAVSTCSIETTRSMYLQGRLRAGSEKVPGSIEATPPCTSRAREVSRTHLRDARDERARVAHAQRGERAERVAQLRSLEQLDRVVELDRDRLEARQKARARRRKVS